jgi:hypothetical protein
MTEQEIIYFLECEESDSDYYHRKFPNREFYEKLRHESYDMAIKALKAIEKLKTEMKAMKIQASECSNADFSCGYISAISTLEGYISILESGGESDGD